MKLRTTVSGAAALLVVLAVRGTAQPVADPASDVVPWARADYERARVAGAMQGAPDGRFYGQRIISRYETTLALGRLPHDRLMLSTTRTPGDTLVAVLSPAARISAPPEFFKDHPGCGWGGPWSAIDALLRAGMLQAYPDGYFRGKRALTRGELATLAYRLFQRLPNRPRPDLARAKFSDVAGSEWWFGAELIAVGSGLMDGYPDRTFRGEAPATRDELAAVIGRLLRLAAEAKG